MDDKKHISDFTLDDFDYCPIWETTLDLPEGCDDELVRPAHGKTSIRDGESDQWVRFSGKLADGTEIKGIAMAEAPPPDLLLLSFFIEDRWIVLNLPPAPDFVLGKTGPMVFAKNLKKTLNETFPISIQSEIVAESTGRVITKIIKF
ncbi:MAG: hypothetical protein KJ826_03525 [Proteobacteria bacterium]|nr:hypothetical protein [Pseudomonadota bacterium]